MTNNKLPWLVAGPCSAESEEQMLKTAHELAKIENVKYFRAGIWKPRTRPSNFEGVGITACDWLLKVKNETGLKVITEIGTPKHAEQCINKGLDAIWLGTRTTVNPFLVTDIANAIKGSGLTVFVKNPVNADTSLWQGAIERILDAGISNVIAIFRGFSVYEEHLFRNRPNWKIPIELKRRMPDIEIICDPSHIAGKKELILPVCQMAVDTGMTGFMIEVHNDPASALSDKEQQITPDELKILLSKLVIKKTGVAENEVLAELDELRNEINNIDYTLLKVLSDRMKISDKIGNIKKYNNLSIVRLKRFNEVLSDRIEKAQKLGLDKDFIKELFEAIHMESVRNQFDTDN